MPVHGIDLDERASLDIHSSEIVSICTHVYKSIFESIQVQYTPAQDRIIIEAYTSLRNYLWMVASAAYQVGYIPMPIVVSYNLTGLYKTIEEGQTKYWMHYMDDRNIHLAPMSIKSDLLNNVMKTGMSTLVGRVTRSQRQVEFANECQNGMLRALAGLTNIFRSHPSMYDGMIYVRSGLAVTTAVWAGEYRIH